MKHLQDTPQTLRERLTEYYHSHAADHDMWVGRVHHIPGTPMRPVPVEDERICLMQNGEDSRMVLHRNTIVGEVAKIGNLYYLHALTTEREGPIQLGTGHPSLKDATDWMESQEEVLKSIFGILILHAGEESF